MKLFLTAAVAFCIMHTANAQSNDPTYSVHNYKHPNKAQVAKALDLDKQLHLPYVEPSADNSSANYKAQAKPVGISQHGALIPSQGIEKNVNAMENPRNYKRQNQ